MMKMYQLVQWLQEEYPQLVEKMKDSDHHNNEFVFGIESFSNVNLHQLEGGLNYIEYVGEGLPEIITTIAKVNINPYHIESDVWTHTMMVCKQAENAPYEVQIAALLHDIGKPTTRSVNPKNGRVSFYNHDAVSAFMSLEILNRPELGLSKEQKVTIFNMIALHTQVYKLSVEQLAAIGNLDLVDRLIQLGNADHEGRFHSHEGASIPTIKDIPYKEYYLNQSLIEPKKEVIILCGLPGSGKSTYSTHLAHKLLMEDNEDFHYVSRDKLISKKYPDLSYDVAWKKCKQSQIDKELQEDFKEGKNFSTVIVDMTHMSKKSRRKSLSHFGPEYKKKCVVFLPDLPKLHLQNEQRSGKVIDRSVIERMIRSFYPPTLGEGFDQIEYIL